MPAQRAFSADDADETRMLAYASGSAAAFDTLYARHKGPVYRYLLRQCGNHRYLMPTETLAQHRRVSLGRPGARYRASLGESRFVDEEDDAPLAPGFF